MEEQQCERQRKKDVKRPRRDEKPDGKVGFRRGRHGLADDRKTRKAQQDGHEKKRAGFSHFGAAVRHLEHPDEKGTEKSGVRAGKEAAKQGGESVRQADGLKKGDERREKHDEPADRDHAPGRLCDGVNERLRRGPVFSARPAAFLRPAGTKPVGKAERDAEQQGRADMGGVEQKAGPRAVQDAGADGAYDKGGARVDADTEKAVSLPPVDGAGSPQLRSGGSSHRVAADDPQAERESRAAGQAEEKARDGLKKTARLFGEPAADDQAAEAHEREEGRDDDVRAEGEAVPRAPERFAGSEQKKRAGSEADDAEEERTGPPGRP